MKYTITYTEQVTYTATVEATSKEEALDQFNTECIIEDNVVDSEAVYTSIEEVSQVQPTNTIKKQYYLDLPPKKAFGAIATQEGVKVEINIRLETPRFASFELYDTETGGTKLHDRGGLWFTDKELVGYDGIFALPKEITDILEKQGYTITMNDYKKIEWIHFAIQEALNGNADELTEALSLLEDIRESYNKNN